MEKLSSYYYRNVSRAGAVPCSAWRANFIQKPGLNNAAYRRRMRRHVGRIFSSIPSILFQQRFNCGIGKKSGPAANQKKNAELHGLGIVTLQILGQPR